MPTTVRRVRIRADFPTLTANFVVVINGRVIVNAVLGDGARHRQATTPFMTPPVVPLKCSRARARSCLADCRGA